MAKDIYKNNNARLRELKQLRSVPTFAKEIQRLSKQINQRFYRIEKKGLSNDTAYRYAQRETEKEKPRYTVNLDKLEKMSIQELYEIGIQINSKLVSKTSTISGLREIAEKRITRGLEAVFSDDGKDLKDEWKTFLNNGGGELLNNKWYDSYQIAEDWREFVASGGVSVKQFIKAYDTMKDKENFDYGVLRRKLIRMKK